MQGIHICYLPQFLGQGHALGPQISLMIPICTFSPREQYFNSSSTAEKYSFIPVGHSTFSLFYFQSFWYHCYQLLLVQEIPPTQNPALSPGHNTEHDGFNFTLYHIRKKNPEVWEWGSGYRVCSIDKRSILQLQSTFQLRASKCKINFTKALLR